MMLKLTSVGGYSRLYIQLDVSNDVNNTFFFLTHLHKPRGIAGTKSLRSEFYLQGLFYDKVSTNNCMCQFLDLSKISLLALDIDGTINGI